MALLKRFIHYLVETYLTAGDRFDNTMRGLGGLLIVGLVLARWVAPRTSSLSFLETPDFKDWCEHGLAVVLILWGLIWVPFKRHEEQNDANRRLLQEVEAPLARRIQQLESLLHPKLSIRCGMNIDGCVSPSPQSNRYYFRAEIINDCPQQGLDGGIAHLLRVEYDGMPLPIQGTRVLPFAPSHEPDADAKVLKPGVPYYVDVVVVSITAISQEMLLPETRGGMAAPLKPDGLHSIFERTGEYLLTIGVSANGIVRTDAVLRFTWTGKFQTSAISLA